MKPDAIDSKATLKEKRPAITRLTDIVAGSVSARTGLGHLTARWPELLVVTAILDRYRTDWIRDGVLLSVG